MTDYLHVELPREELVNVSALGLAHVGDCVYELMVRSWIVCHGHTGAGDMHHVKEQYVTAASQQAALARISPLLSEEETAVCHRGRNAHVNSVPRRATLSQYHAATALECLFGWLYLRGEHGRLNELFAVIMEPESSLKTPQNM